LIPYRNLPVVRTVDHRVGSYAAVQEGVGL